MAHPGKVHVPFKQKSFFVDEGFELLLFGPSVVLLAFDFVAGADGLELGVLDFLGLGV